MDDQNGISAAPATVDSTAAVAPTAPPPPLPDPNTAAGPARWDVRRVVELTSLTTGLMLFVLSLAAWSIGSGFLGRLGLPSGTFGFSGALQVFPLDAGMVVIAMLLGVIFGNEWCRMWSVEWPRAKQEWRDWVRKRRARRHPRFRRIKRSRAVVHGETDPPRENPPPRRARRRRSLYQNDVEFCALVYGATFGFGVIAGPWLGNTAGSFAAAGLGGLAVFIFLRRIAAGRARSLANVLFWSFLTCVTAILIAGLYSGRAIGDSVGRTGQRFPAVTIRSNHSDLIPGMDPVLSGVVAEVWTYPGRELRLISRDEGSLILAVLDGPFLRTVQIPLDRVMSVSFSEEPTPDRIAQPNTPAPGPLPPNPPVTSPGP